MAAQLVASRVVLSSTELVSSSAVILMRLSGPRSGPTTLRQFGSAGNRTPEPVDL
jgi:hypothetical protein